MSNMLKLVIDFVAYVTDQPENNPQYGDATKIKNSVSQAFSELSRSQFKIGTSVTDQVISLVDAQCDYILVFCDRPLSMKINGSTTALELIPKSNGVKSLVFMNKGLITSLSVSNASASDEVNVDLISVNL